MRGLKSNIIHSVIATRSVALYTSAWIEIGKSIYDIEITVVALYTSAWIEMYSPRTSCFQRYVALYTSAWIEINFRQAIRTSWPVALYTSAWIEIDIVTGHFANSVCRTLHECVD